MIVHLEHKLNTKYHEPRSISYPDILFTTSLMAKMPKSGKGHNSVKYMYNVFIEFYEKLTRSFISCTQTA